MNKNLTTSPSTLQDLKWLASEMLSQLQGTPSDPDGVDEKNAIVTLDHREDSPVELAAGTELPETVRTANGNANFVGLLQQLELLAKRQPPRVAFKAKGRILFVEIAEIVAVQAEGNYVSLRHRSSSYLLRESISSMAQKLKPYGFVRIHRSVLVNSFLVDQIQPLSTGEYRLRVRDGKEYLVTRTYKVNLRYLAHLWLGSERLSS